MSIAAIILHASANETCVQTFATEVELRASLKKTVRELALKAKLMRENETIKWARGEVTEAGLYLRMPRESTTGSLVRGSKEVSNWLVTSSEYVSTQELAQVSILSEVECRALAVSQEELYQQEAALQKLARRLATAEAQLTNAVQALKDKEAVINQANALVSELDAQLTQSEALLAKRNDAIDALNEAMDNLEEDHHAYLLRLEEMTDAHTRIQTHVIEEQARRIKELEEALVERKSLPRTLALTKQQLEATTEHAEELQQELGKATSELDFYKFWVDILEEQLRQDAREKKELAMLQEKAVSVPLPTLGYFENFESNWDNIWNDVDAENVIAWGEQEL